MDVKEKVGADGKLQKEENFRALYIKGSSKLPFAEEEMIRITQIIEGVDPTVKKIKDRNLKVNRVCSMEDLYSLIEKSKDTNEFKDQFKVVHFSGHYSDKCLLIDDRQINTEMLLLPFIQNSLLVLDGCSSSRDVTGWSDVGGITSQMINYGAFGCITTVLPIKDDPIVENVFWKEFYRNFVFLRYSVGFSLHKARLQLKNHYKTLNSTDPTWLFYQLIGSPSTKLFDDADIVI
jgi:hypothetical protein